MNFDSTTKRILKDPKKRASWIIYQLKLRGESLASLARKFGNTRQIPTAALRKPYPLWEKRIADAIGVMPQDLFPERYDSEGLPNRNIGRPTNNTVKYRKNYSKQKNRNNDSEQAA